MITRGKTILPSKLIEAESRRHKSNKRLNRNGFLKEHSEGALPAET